MRVFVGGLLVVYIKSNKLDSWDEFKEAQGRGSENVNLAYSMWMWTNI